MSDTKVVPKEKTMRNAKYFVTSSSNYLRPYGVCIKQL